MSVSAGSGNEGPDRLRQPREVLEVLGLQGRATYRQLRELAMMSNELGPDPTAQFSPRVWLRLDLRGIARVAVLIDLCGGPEALSPGRRLMRRRPIRETCSALRSAPYLFVDPLLDVPMIRAGNSVLAWLDGVLLNPATGQGTLLGGDWAQRSLTRRLLNSDPRFKEILRPSHPVL